MQDNKKSAVLFFAVVAATVQAQKLVPFDNENGKVVIESKYDIARGF